MKEQAIRQATRHNGTGILKVYKYNPVEALNIKVFPEMTEEWLDFIVACRSGKSHSYDIVEGPMEDEFIQESHIEEGDYDNVAACKYTVPSYWDIGEVFVRLIEDAYVEGEDLIKLIMDIYNSWLANAISNYNSDLYQQPRD